jgi:hypothetical protein
MSDAEPIRVARGRTAREVWGDEDLPRISPPAGSAQGGAAHRSTLHGAFGDGSRRGMPDQRSPHPAYRSGRPPSASGTACSNPATRSQDDPAQPRVHRCRAHPGGDRVRPRDQCSADIFGGLWEAGAERSTPRTRHWPGSSGSSAGPRRRRRDASSRHLRQSLRADDRPRDREISSWWPAPPVAGSSPVRRRRPLLHPLRRPRPSMSTSSRCRRMPRATSPG